MKINNLREGAIRSSRQSPSTEISTVRCQRNHMGLTAHICSMAGHLKTKSPLSLALGQTPPGRNKGKRDLPCLPFIYKRRDTAAFARSYFCGCYGLNLNICL